MAPAVMPATAPPPMPPKRAQVSTISTIRIRPRDTPPKVTLEKESATTPAVTVAAATSPLS